MKKLRNSLLLVTLLAPVLAYADQAPTQVPVTNGQVVIESPRTGIQYTVPNPNQRPVIIQTKALEVINTNNVDRIVATNPALSPESQQAAKKALLDLAK
ncbi:hypothetical protein B9T31_14245 [Acinetobacter sp. ANC 4558]|uniref:hypothetical protein n=1 Tax=Acinetobacter sp. ANC 4558 TaxID=1977876 RepID=UPI000A343F16|nr:hypothetical protein [Acinetobacter sp. ANC 4558]OTG83246.1 hypothetical protein B9T31_14245 [Acinetobacter sp. ANC 4558]